MPLSCQDGDRAGWHHTIARFTPVSIAGELVTCSEGMASDPGTLSLSSSRLDRGYNGAPRGASRFARDAAEFVHLGGLPADLARGRDASVNMR